MTKIFRSGGAAPPAPVLASPAGPTLTPGDASPAAAALAAAKLAEEEKKRKKGQGTVLGGDYGEGAGSADNSSAGDAADGGPW